MDKKYDPFATARNPFAPPPVVPVAVKPYSYANIAWGLVLVILCAGLIYMWIVKTQWTLVGFLEWLQSTLAIYPSSPTDPTVHPLATSTNKDPELPPVNASEAPDISTVGKPGWCYIGTEKGFRSCASVRPNDVCMSGTIYPTREICINPSLRL